MTLGLSLLALVLGASLHGDDPVGQWLELNPEAIGGGELWRLLTGHLVHFTPRHLWLDVLAFACLGWVCERRLGTAAVAGLLTASALVVATGVVLLEADLGRYRGLSALATTLFAALLVRRVREAYRSCRFRAWLLPSIVGVLFAAKLGYEFLTGGGAVFNAFAGSEIVACPVAHLLGALIGAVGALYRGRFYALTLFDTGDYHDRHQDPDSSTDTTTEAPVCRRDGVVLEAGQSLLRHRFGPVDRGHRAALDRCR